LANRRRRRRRTNRKTVALWVLATELIALGYFVYSVVHRDLVSAGGSVSIAIAIVSWLFAVKVPTRCGVTTLRGHPCPNPTTGVIFGCGSANHTWAKLLENLGFRRSPPNRSRPEHSSVPSASASPATANYSVPIDPVRPTAAEREIRRNSVLFWLTIVSTTGGLVSTTTDIIGVFRN
jgi:hypothetical protein